MRLVRSVTRGLPALLATAALLAVTVPGADAAPQAAAASAPTP